MTPEQIAGLRVTRGIQRLTPGCPLWWDNRNGPALEPMFLDFTDPAHGLLAAIYGSHDIGLRRLGIESSEAASYGFAAEDEAGNVTLRRLWALAVNSSRAEAASIASTNPLR